MCSAGLLYAQREHTDSRSDTVGVRVEGRRVLPLTLSCRSVVLPRTVHRVMLSRRSVRGSLRYFYVPYDNYNADVRPSYRKRPWSACCFAAPRPPTSSPTCTSRTVRISVISYQTAHVTSWVQPSCCRCRRHGRARGRDRGRHRSWLAIRGSRSPDTSADRRVNSWPMRGPHCKIVVR